MKRNAFFTWVCVLMATSLLIGCTAKAPETPVNDTPVNEETPAEPETYPETSPEAPAETPGEAIILEPLENPQNVTYDQENLSLDAMSVNILNITKSFDLDSDGLQDEIFMYARDFTMPGSAPEIYEEYELIVNGLNVRGYDYDFEPRFNIVDLDAGDRYREIAVGIYGESEDPATTFYHYSPLGLVNLGTIPGFYGKRYLKGNPTEEVGSVVIDGSGIIKTLSTSSFLMTWTFEDEYKLENDTRLIRVEKDLYPMNAEVRMIQDLTLKKSREDLSDGITLRQGDTVTLTDCDNKEWVSVMNSAGEIGWFAVDQFNSVVGTGKSGTEIFDGLFSAG